MLSLHKRPGPHSLSSSSSHHHRCRRRRHHHRRHHRRRRHHHLSLNCKGRWGTTDDFTTSSFRFSLFSTALWDLANSRPVHSLMLSFHFSFCLPCLLPPFTVPCKMVLARPDERETCPYHCSLLLFTMVRRASCGPIACWILARTSWLVNGLYMRCIVSCGFRFLQSFASRKVYKRNVEVKKHVCVCYG